jgi:hypothetical protein
MSFLAMFAVHRTPLMMIELREVRRMAILLIVLIAVAAVVNVPWAVTMIRSRVEAPNLPAIVQLSTGAQMLEWPSRTPHAKPWLPPEYWYEFGAFGCRLIDARSLRPNPNVNGYSMQVQWVGWPLPVIEIKQMWWNWDDPALQGPEPDPRPSLMLGGLLLNPLLLGGGAWLALILPWLIFTVIRRTSRWRNARCIACGYPVGTSDTCTECGATLMHHAR